MADGLDGSSAAIQAAMRAGNINTAQGGPMEVMDLSSTSLAEQERHASLLRRIEAERRARSIIVPTHPDEVKVKLRSLGQPVRLFGENLADVRERLRELYARIEVDGEESVAAATSGAPEAQQRKRQKEDVYTEASAELIEARQRMFDFSTSNANHRIAGMKRRMDSDEEKARIDSEARELYKSMKEIGITASQFGDERPMSACRCAPGGNIVATSSLASYVKLWNTNSLESEGVLGGPGAHAERVTGLSWHPQAYQTDSKPLLATGSADMTAKLWDSSTQTPLVTFKGHRNRISNIDFHPSGEYVGTSSFDHTWRLWHCETGRELLLQDGHIKEVQTISFQKDGALVATGDFSGVGNVWDLRGGKKIFSMLGHVKRIVCADFAPNGFQIATGGDDHTVRIWDIRKRACAYTLPAHSSLISEIRFLHSHSHIGVAEAMLTTSFDGKVRVWGTRDWRMLTELSGHEGKIMAGDFSPDGKKIFTVGYDRTLKLWSELTF